MALSVQGSFANPGAESTKSILITDNNLTDGYASGFDLDNAPTELASGGPAGSAAFQWGTGAGNSYPHPSALWFQPLNAGIIAPEQSFDLGYLYYRNGSIGQNTGASWVDIALTLAFEQPLGIDPISVTFGSNLINSNNNSDPVASADIVELDELYKGINFNDVHGNQYFLELTFQVDQTTIDGTLSTIDRFRVFEGSQGRATLLGKLTTTPAGFTGTLIPEPSSALLGGLGMLLLFRRKR